METIFRKLLPGGRITKSPPPLRPQIEENSSPATRPPGVIDRLLARHAQPTANNVRVRKTGVRTTDRPARSTRTNPPTYQVEAEAEDSSNPERYSLVHGLGAPWKHQLTYGSGRRRATVDFLDLERLDEGEFLNDQLIDFYMLYLFNLKPQLANKVYIFNTHFFSTLTRKVPGQKSAINYSAVARWTAKEDLFGYDYIVVPINQDVHWFVAIICNVSNISRKLAVEDSIDQAAYDETVDNMPASEQGPGQAKATDTAVRTTSPLLMSDSYPPPLVEEQDDEMLLNSEESKFDLIDTQATEPSPAAETTRMEQLTLGDPAPIGILPNAGSSPDSKKTRRKPPVKKWDSDQPTIIILDSLASGARSPAVRALKNYLFEEGREKRGIEAKIPQNAFYAKPSQIPTQENYYDCGIYLLAYMQQFFENPDEFKDRLLGGEMRTGDWPEMEIPNMRDRMRDILQQLHKKQEEERKLSGKEKKAKSSEPVPKTTDVATKAPMPAAKKEDAAVPAAAPLATKTATEPSPPKSTPDICDEKPPVADSFRRLSSPFKYKPAPVIKQTNGRNSSPIRETTIMKVDNTPSPPGYAEKDQHAQQQSWLDRQDEVSASSNPPTRRKSPVVLIPSPEKRRLVNEQTKSSPSTVKARSPKKQRVVSPPKAGVAEMASKKASTSAKLESPVRVRSPASDSRGSSQNPISLDDSQEPAVVASFTPKTPKAQFVQTSSATVKNGNSSRKQHHRPEHLLDGAMDGKDSHVLETIEVSRAKVYDDLPEIVSPSIIMKRAVQQPYEKPYDRAEDSAVPETPPAETRSPAAAGASLSQPISL
jgi:sentrin-specific protease 7